MNSNKTSQPNVNQPSPLKNENPVQDLVDSLQSVDPKAPNSEANASSISDNNGGRIELNEDPDDPNFIKK